MAQKNRQKDRVIGKPKEEKKHLIDPKHKNTVWTIIIVIILLIIFIINNTRKTPDHGPYPPNYNQKAAQERLK
jgi:uncharacterized integral membrane protein